MHVPHVKRIIKVHVLMFTVLVMDAFLVSEGTTVYERYGRVYLPLYKVTGKPFHIEYEETIE